MQTPKKYLLARKAILITLLGLFLTLIRNATIPDSPAPQPQYTPAAAHKPAAEKGSGLAFESLSGKFFS